MGRPVTHPQFKMCHYARITFNRTASTLQDVTGFLSTYRFEEEFTLR